MTITIETDKQTYQLKPEEFATQFWDFLLKQEIVFDTPWNTKEQLKKFFDSYDTVHEV